MPSKINATHLNLSDLVDKWKYTHHINKNTVLKVQLALHFHRKQIISSCCVVVFFFSGLHWLECIHSVGKTAHSRCIELAH